MKSLEASRISCILDRRLLPALEAEFARAGWGGYYAILSKQVTLVEKNGLLRTSNSLAEDRSELIRFPVPRPHAAAVMYRIAQAVDLFLPGRGSIFCEECQLLVDDSFQWPAGFDTEPEPVPAQAVSTDWDLITCIVQRGRGDELARIMLEMGLCVPVVNYGEGMGLRDKIGLLRITIPVQKEVLCLLVPTVDSDFVLDTAMRRAGMDEPGKGFLFRCPVRACAVNNRILRDRRKHVASMEQVISALDELRGSTDWRRLTAANQKKARTKASVNALESFSLTCEEGDAQEIVSKAMALGAGGATLVRASWHAPKGDTEGKAEPKQDARIESQARETCDLIVRPEQASLFEEELMPLILALPNAFAERSPVKDARTYLAT